MINLLHLNKLLISALFFLALILNTNFCFAAEDIWKKQENKNEQNIEESTEEKITIESPILSDDANKNITNISESEILNTDQKIVGLFDPELNNFNLNMWSNSDGEEIKKILKRINKLKLARLSEELLFQVLFTNSYPPKINLTAEEFNKIKIDWLISKKRFNDLEKLVITNPEVGKESKAIIYLVNESLSSGDIKSACKKTEVLEKSIENNYLEKFKIYCLINNDRKDEAQLILDLLKERGFKDVFFEDKINFLLGVKKDASSKTSDKNLLNFYLSHITNNNFEYEPTDKTDKYIWRYLSSANLIEVENFESEEVILTYEQAAAENAFDNDEIFKIYLKMPFNFNQLKNSNELYKNMPNYKARALIYQSLLLSDDIEKKLYFSFLLKDLFMKDKLFNVYSRELSNILGEIDPDQIPRNYIDLVNENIEQNNNTQKIKFDNDILHRSKVIKHFIEKNEKINRTKKDFKSVYKKIKKNKKYFISIKDIAVLESLAMDGVSIPNDLDYESLLSQINVPKNLEDLAAKNQIGLVMLKVIEIIGEDNIQDLDPETIYFLTKILNNLNLKKIRNSILSEALPIKA